MIESYEEARPVRRASFIGALSPMGGISTSGDMLARLSWCPSPRLVVRAHVDMLFISQQPLECVSGDYQQAHPGMWNAHPLSESDHQTI